MTAPTSAQDVARTAEDLLAQLSREQSADQRLARITAALQAERARTIEACAKIVCHNCFKGTPFNADGQHIITEPSGNRYPRDCEAHEIRRVNFGC